MINATIEGFLRIWPRVFPTMLVFLGLGTILATIIVLLSAFFSGLAQEKMIKKYVFLNGYPVKLGSFKGSLKYSSFDIILTLWIAVLLMPVISFLPIMLFDASILLRDLLIIGFIPGFILSQIIMRRVNRRFEETKIYFYSSGIGLNRLGKDYIYPNKAIKRLRVDREKKWLAMGVKYRFFPESWGNIYLEFTSLEELENCVKTIVSTIDIPVDSFSFKSLYYKLVTIHKNVQIIPYSDLAIVIHPKTQRILEGEEEYLPTLTSTTIEDKQIKCPLCFTIYTNYRKGCPKCTYRMKILGSYPYLRYMGWVIFTTVVFTLLPLVIPGVLEWQASDEYSVLYLWAYSLGLLTLLGFMTDRFHFQSHVYQHKPREFVLTLIVGLILVIETFLWVFLTIQLPLTYVSELRYFFVTPLTAYIMGGFFIYFIIVKFRMRTSLIDIADVDIKTQITQAKEGGEQGDLRFCPHCGKNRYQSGKFCISCGYQFEEATDKVHGRFN